MNKKPYFKHNSLWFKKKKTIIVQTIKHYKYIMFKVGLTVFQVKIDIKSAISKMFGLKIVD